MGKSVVLPGQIHRAPRFLLHLHPLPMAPYLFLREVRLQIRLLLLALCLPLLLVLPNLAQAMAFENLSHGAILDANFATTPVGDVLMGELGGQSLGSLATTDRQWLVQWHALLAFKAGALAATLPFTTLLGGRTRLMAEAGYRFLPALAWSPYLGARLAGDAQWMLPPGVSMDELRIRTNIDGVGDLNVSGHLRLTAGASWLQTDRALLLTAVVQGWTRAGEIHLPSATFVDVGLSARLDLAHSWSLSVETLWGKSPITTSPTIGVLDDTSRWQISGEGRKIFSNGMWIGSEISYVTQSDSLRTGTLSWQTRSAPTFDVKVLYGFPLGRQELP